ncbi:GyrI-like domain-containing protein [Paenibacillus sp. LHD-38]|uniref:GyrI-like domain-containing protein n=1 Tax=Paenibacillus sp. LHD-38 TaxID=3072143 RepID=UPI00280E2618|nr:GyrI-like domain-containing protein [Paenibacillus sp. LHD-38]MDQ8734378.1 GyrI-like domain-containing protein [Paenibacillus sp. LHD-38]
MKAYQTAVIEREELKLIGFSIIESLNHVLQSKIVGALREGLAQRLNEIENRIGTGIYLIQIYPQDGQWTPDVPFQHVIAFEVSSIDKIPTGMINHTVPPGRFIKIVHKGLESQIAATYNFINNTYGGRPIDIEYWNDIHTLESEEGLIDIYIPAQ